jgi:flagella basal body P-ring formation protein FlgA
MKIFFVFFAFCAATFAATHILEESYLINDDKIMASHVMDIETRNDFVIDRFDNKSAVQFPLNKLKRIFEDRNISVDSRAAIVTFYYARDVDFEYIKNAVSDRFLETYQTMLINDIIIKPLSYVDISGLEIVQIDVSQNALRGAKGSFAVWFGSEDSKIKRAFFSFEIDANLRVLRASRQIASGAILSKANVEETLIVLDRIGSKPIDKSSLDKIVAKNRLNKGDIITDKNVAIVPDVRKNSQITAELVKNGVKLSFLAVVQKDADIGDLVTVKDQNKRSFTARIISKDLARIE